MIHELCKAEARVSVLLRSSMSPFLETADHCATCTDPTSLSIMFGTMGACSILIALSGGSDWGMAWLYRGTGLFPVQEKGLVF